jgi:hypothetical protein
MRRWKKVLIGVAIFAALIAGVAWLYGSAIFDDCLFCCYEYEDTHLGPFLPPVDETKIMLLGGLKNQNGAFSESDISFYKILGQTTLHGNEAADIAEGWRCLPRNQRLSDLCHSPLYALQFQSKGHLLLETTICWHCNNYTLSPGGHPWLDGDFGFDANSPISQAFLATLEKYVPPPKR